MPPQALTGFKPLSFYHLAVILLLLVVACSQTPVIGTSVDADKLKDGIYRGSYRGGPNKAVVDVDIRDKTIVGIEIVDHQAWKGRKAEEPVIKQIIEQQSTRVDAVSGATNSSHVIMNAVQKAIEKAY